MLITNKKVITTKDQNDLQKLHDFVTTLFEMFNSESDKDLKPEDYLEDGKYVYYRVPEGMKTEMILEAGCELCAIEGDEVIELPGSVLALYKYVFSPQENEENAEMMSRSVRLKREYQNSKAESSAQWDTKIKEQEAVLQKMANFVENKYDMKEEKCVVILDYEQKKRLYKSISTKQIVKTEEMNEDDMQYKQFKIVFPFN